jgi:hypothetical protein
VKHFKKLCVLGLAVTLFTGCATTPKSNRDLSAYHANMPKSILVLPPVNESPDTRATYGYWSTVTLPVAEAGYYVFPISVVDTLFKENGVTNGYDAQQIPIQNHKRKPHRKVQTRNPFQRRMFKMTKRLHNTQLKECLKHYKYTDFIRYEQLFYMFYTKSQ